MYELIFSGIALKQLEKLPKEIQKRILATLERIRPRPESYLKKLIGVQGYRLRVGDYRVIVDVDGDRLAILVLKIGHRKNIYK